MIIDGVLVILITKTMRTNKYNLVIMDWVLISFLKWQHNENNIVIMDCVLIIFVSKTINTQSK